MRKKLKKILCKDNIFLKLQAEDKEGIIREMISRLTDCGMIKDKESALRAVIERENKMSTGMKNGVAIPHGKTDSVEQLIAAVALKISGVDFDSTDGQPSFIFIMTISPASRSGPHIQFLAEVSKILRDAGARKRLLAAENTEEVIKIFS